MSKLKNKVIYGNGKIMRFYWLIVACLTVFFLGAAIISFISSVFWVGIFAIIFMLITWMCIGMILSNKQVVFYVDYMEIPKEYISRDKLFSKTKVSYETLKKVEFLLANETENDCTGTNGGKVACIKFVDKDGEIYRMKVEYFSDKQVDAIINEVKRRAEIK